MSFFPYKVLKIGKRFLPLSGVIMRVNLNNEPHNASLDFAILHSQLSQWRRFFFTHIHVVTYNKNIAILKFCVSYGPRRPLSPKSGFYKMPVCMRVYAELEPQPFV